MWNSIKFIFRSYWLSKWWSGCNTRPDMSDEEILVYAQWAKILQKSPYMKLKKCHIPKPFIWKVIVQLKYTDTGIRTDKSFIWRGILRIRQKIGLLYSAVSKILLITWFMSWLVQFGIYFHSHAVLSFY